MPRPFKPPWRRDTAQRQVIQEKLSGYELAHFARLGRAKGLETRRVTSKYISPSRETSST